MAAPKNPNPGPGAAAARRRKWDRWAAEMRDAGWLVVEPDDLTYRQAVDRISDQHYAAHEQINDALTKFGLAMRRDEGLVDPGHELVQSFTHIADLLRELRPAMRTLRKILPRARRMRHCQRCSRAGGELTENGCPTCGPDAEIA